MRSRRPGEQRRNWCWCSCARRASANTPVNATIRRDSLFARAHRIHYTESMKTDSGRTVSVWMATADTGGQPELKKDVAADICVVGAGIAGVTTAYLLTREGKRVVLLDDGAIAGVAT